MPGPRPLILIALLACWAAGCAQHAQPSVPAGWVRSKGGCVDSTAHSVRVDRACAALGVSATVRILGSSEPVAYSWRDGDVFVSVGLLELLDDDELAAAIAHEIGHLARSDRAHGALSLRGRKHGLDAEVAADRVGVDLLRAAGIPPKVMAVMLAKVQDAATLQAVYVAEMNHRIGRLRQTSAPAPR